MVWLLVLVRLDESTSIHRYNQLKDQLRFLRLQQFPAQDVVKFVVKARAIYKELFAANQCDELITRDVVNNLMQGGGGYQQWIYILMPILIALDKALLEIGHMSRADQRTHLSQHDPPFC